MKNIYMSDNACYAGTHVAVPLSLNTANHYLGYTSTARSDVTIVKYSLYEYHGLYWYCIVVDEGKAMNSLFFVAFANCIRDLRSLFHTMEWELEDSAGLSNFVAQYNRAYHERGV